MKVFELRPINNNERKEKELTLGDVPTYGLFILCGCLYQAVGRFDDEYVKVRQFTESDGKLCYNLEELTIHDRIDQIIPATHIKIYEKE